MVNRWGSNGSSEILYLFIYFLGSKIIADGDCSHEVNRHWLLERKAMANMDSILKSRDITLPTKVHLVKTTVFPVVMYGCESYKEVWVLKNQCFRTVMLEKTLESPLDCKEIQPVNPNIEINPEYSLKGLMLKLKIQHFDHLMWTAKKTLMLGKIEGTNRRE